MKKEYETPSVDVFVFETPEAIMDSVGGCSTYYNPNVPCHTDIDIPDCILDSASGCYLYGNNCVLDGVCVSELNICLPEIGLSAIE